MHTEKDNVGNDIPLAINTNANHIDEAYVPDFDDGFDDEQPMLNENTILPKQMTTIRGNSLLIKILLLTLSLAGLQFTWSVEMAYGTPYLLSLGLSKSHMSLVWIAGPLSGLIMQPIVGIFSDKCTSKWGRRRPFMVGGSILVVLNLLAIGWTRELTALFVDINDTSSYKKVSIFIAIACIYLLDFSINCVQASCRALIVDALLPTQQAKGTALAGVMIGAGNVIGYFMGYIDLVKAFPFLGDTQLKVLCAFASIILLTCDAITCFSVKEKVLQSNKSSDKKTSTFKTFNDIASNIWNLPPKIRQICNIQFFSWIGWFPFLFYSTTWVAEIYDNTSLNRQKPEQGNSEEATRVGSLAFLVYSIISLVSSFLVPLLVNTTSSSSSSPSSLNNNDHQNLENGLPISIRDYRSILSSLKHINLTIPNIWTIGHFIFCFSILSSIFVNDVILASIIIGICGISWSITMWAPFSLLGEYISQYEQPNNDDIELISQQQQQQQRTANDIIEMESNEPITNSNNINPYPSQSSSPNHIQYRSTSSVSVDDYNDEQINNNYNNSNNNVDFINNTETNNQEQQINNEEINIPTMPSAGILLGIHNIYIVLPQFLVTFCSSVLFHFLEKKESLDEENVPPDTIGVVLRFGAVMTGIAGLLSLKLNKNNNK
ncbi:unnamed protein product [Cunninghamella echinulata]